MVQKDVPPNPPFLRECIFKSPSKALKAFYALPNIPNLRAGCDVSSGIVTIGANDQKTIGRYAKVLRNRGGRDTTPDD